MKCKKYIAIERNGMKGSDFTEKISWNIVAFANLLVAWWQNTPLLILGLGQGSLTEGEGSVQLTPLY
jgi:hypothetical protein